MPRAIWKGHISFGLVNVPVQLQSAEKRTDLQLHMLDSRNFARVRYERVNSETGAEVPWNEIVRGYEYSDGNYVTLSDEELKRAAPEATKAIEIEAFVEADQIDRLYYDKPYYLEPGKGGDKGYVLLREAMAEAGRVGIARVVIRTRQYVAALIPHEDLLLLELLRYPQELRSADDLDIPRGSAKSHGVTAQELKVAKTLVESMAASWDPESFHDEYREALMTWVEKKVKSGEIHEPLEGHDAEAEDEPPAPINFMELLKKSVAKNGRSATAKKAPARRPARSTKKKAPTVRRRKAG